MSGSSRREFVKTAASQVGMLSIPSLLSNPFPVEKKLKIVCLGAHPDDPKVDVEAHWRSLPGLDTRLPLFTSPGAKRASQVNPMRRQRPYGVTRHWQHAKY